MTIEIGSLVKIIDRHSPYRNKIGLVVGEYPANGWSSYREFKILINEEIIDGYPRHLKEIIT